MRHFKQVFLGCIYALCMSTPAFGGNEIHTSKVPGVHEYLYNAERFSKSIRRKSDMPLIFVWIKEIVPHIKRVYNTYSFPGPTEISRSDEFGNEGMNLPVDAYGLSYQGRSIIMFVNNQFLRITNLKGKEMSKWYHDRELGKKIEKAQQGLSLDEFFGNDHVTETIDKLKYVYITDEKDAWKKYLSISEFDVCNPVTMLIYTKDFADKVLNGSRDDAEAINLLRK